jgi:hypothetical protein
MIRKVFEKLDYLQMIRIEVYEMQTFFTRLESNTLESFDTPKATNASSYKIPIHIYEFLEHIEKLSDIFRSTRYEETSKPNVLNFFLFIIQIHLFKVNRLLLLIVFALFVWRLLWNKQCNKSIS